MALTSGLLASIFQSHWTVKSTVSWGFVFPPLPPVSVHTSYWLFPIHIIIINIIILIEPVKTAWGDVALGGMAYWLLNAVPLNTGLTNAMANF